MPASIQSPEQVVQDLPDNLRRDLAILVGSSDADAELLLLMEPFEDRVKLGVLGVLDLISPHDKPSDIAVQVKLTEFGRHVIHACALSLTDEDRRQLQLLPEQLEAARAERARNRPQ